jgi:Fungal specific transcription factor domain
MGMNLQEFATQYGEGSAVLEESRGRTYWMLFTTDQHFAIVRNMPIFGLRDAITTVELPCEESDYKPRVCIISATNSCLLS